MNSLASEISIYEQHPYFFKDSEICCPESDGEPMGENENIALKAELEKLKNLLEKQ